MERIFSVASLPMLPVFYSLAAAVFYALVWRIPINVSAKPSYVRTPLAILSFVLISLFLTYLLPMHFFYLMEIKSLPDKLIFVEESPYGLYCLGFFLSTFCLFPMAGWLDTETRSNPAFQDKSNLLLGLFSFLFVFLPYLVLFSYRVEFYEDRLYERSLLFSEEETILSYKSFRLESEFRDTRMGKAGTIVEKLSLVLLRESGERKVAFTYLIHPNWHKQHLANIRCHLIQKGLTDETPFVILHFEQWNQDILTMMKPICPQ
ncbi:hypothetical protein LPTSP4_21290 [Leptospira ryugenii]|uniref:Uncharacterized protein n=1 Tax=Leptospira ryugenii TaxID=1917863 RepID=A0A2P2E141_9LEPT|nr:hypothetical protein [Leptospira ryugenii]GBF50603.1 hypothetical protein LPTSP4_21290 [Leptospira ryugenii]